MFSTVRSPASRSLRIFLETPAGRLPVILPAALVSLSQRLRTMPDERGLTDLARQVAGVINVNNNLQIQSDNVTSVSEGQEGGGKINEAMEGEESQHVEAIKGEVLRIEGENYFVRGERGKEVRLHTDATTQKTGDIHEGDRIEAQMNGQNHALSIRSTPMRDRRTEQSEPVQ